MKAARRLLNQGEVEGKSLSVPEALVQVGALTQNQARRVLGSLKEETASPPIQIPGIQLLEKVGRGSQAIVYKGRQVSVDRIVAVKVLLSKSARDPEACRRFVQEAQSAGKLQHNNIVTAYAAGVSDGYPYCLQEFIDGTTVYDQMKAAGRPYSEKRALEIIIQIAEALAHAHSRGLIHRDVKPKNIMLTKEGVPKLADMGLARNISDAAPDEVGKAFGTPYYIAPEQVRGEAGLDFRADIYSLGATFYEMLTGRPPYTAATPQQVMRKQVTGTLVPPDHINTKLSSGVSEVVEVMMGKRPQDRYKSTPDLLVDLRSVAAGEPPRIAREKAGMQDTLMEGLAAGKTVETEATHAPSPPSPFALNTLAILLLAALGVAVLLNVLQLILGH
jgi:serine/threonine-protein kinase